MSFSNIGIKVLRAVLFGSIGSVVYCPSCYFNPAENNFKVFAYYVIAFFITYEIVTWFINYFGKFYNWVNEPYKLVGINIAFLLFVYLPISYIAVELNFLSPKYIGQLYYLKLDNYINAFLILLYTNGKNFFYSWKTSLLQAQELKQHQTKHELLALKNQINPHFLFNNLNTLSHLVSEKNPNTEEYIHQFSNIYRYLLDQKSEDLVDISKEMKMVDALIYLLKIKYGDNINFTINKKNLKNFKIATFTLQMLIENAVKHNIISNKNKLKIELTVNDNYLSIRNNVMAIPQVAYSSGIGLKNIINRYKLLSKNSVFIVESDTHFEVKIPIM